MLLANSVMMLVFGAMWTSELSQSCSPHGVGFGKFLISRNEADLSIENRPEGFK